MEINEPGGDRDERLAWYLEAKFGLFIHWGAYAVAGAEASWPVMAPALSAAMFGTPSTIGEAEYAALPARFDPVDFDAASWVETARAAGMRYIVFTAKHHDGFCMFDAPGTDYKITRTPFGRDVCKELAQACAAAGMRLGFYYSPPDMSHPGYRDTARPVADNWLGEPGRPEWASYLDYMESHVRKLLSDYGEVSLLWFDGLCNHAKYDTPRFHALVRELSPGTLVNDRLGPGYDFITPEQFIPKGGIPVRTGLPPSSNGPESERFFRLVVALFKIPGIRGWIRKRMRRYSDGSLELTPVAQRAYPRPGRFQPWETCMTIGRSWAYNPAEEAWKSPRELLRNLVSVAAKGGNYLLNVGPTERGLFPPEALERLAHIGGWMERNGDSLYGSSYSPLPEQAWGRATRRGGKVFLHVFDWPEGGSLAVEGFPATVRAAALLSGGSLGFTQEGGRLSITVPARAPDPDVAVLVLDVDADDPAWSTHPAEAEGGVEPGKYLKTQAITSALVNGLVNGLIALATYRSRAGIPFAEAAVDLPISVAIISFLTSWLVVASARGEIDRGRLRKPERKSGRRGMRLPRGAVLRALLLALVSTLAGGALLDGLSWLLAADGFTNWGYIAWKTLATAATGALAVTLAVGSLFAEAGPAGRAPDQAARGAARGEAP